MRKKTRKENSWAGFVLGVAIMGVSILVCRLLGIPEYVRSVGLLSGVIAAVIYVHVHKYGGHLWFWVTLAIAFLLHVPILAKFVNQINRASPALTIPIAMFDGILIVIVVVLLADKFEQRHTV